MDGICAGAATTLRAHLNELEGCWLHIRCGGCPGATAHPVRLLLAKYGPDHEIGAVVARLTCKRCGMKPATVTISDAPNQLETRVARVAWSVQLIDRPAISAVDRAQAEALHPM